MLIPMVIMLYLLTPKRQMVFIEFWSRSHFLSLHPIFLIFLGLFYSLRSIQACNFFSKLFVDLDI